MQKTLRALALTLTLCAPAFAGDIPNPPAPPKPTSIVEEPTSGLSETEAPDTITEAALYMLESVVALF